MKQRMLLSPRRIAADSFGPALLMNSGILVALVVLSLMLGAVALTPAQVVGALLRSSADVPASAIVWNLRLPRVLLTCVAGALIGVAALLLSRLLDGSMRDPGWNGIASLGALGAVILLASAPTQPWWALALVVSTGCGLGLSILAGARQCWPRNAGHVRVLGVAVALTAPALAFALLIGDVRIATWVRWCLGSLEQRDWTTWHQAWPVAGLALLALLAHLVWPQRRPALWVATCLTTASATLAAGALGLVGWLAGRLAERSSVDTGKRLTLAAVSGAALLLGADLAVRGLSALLPSLGLISELPVGALLVAASGVMLIRHFWQRPRKT